MNKIFKNTSEKYIIFAYAVKIFNGVNLRTENTSTPYFMASKKKNLITLLLTAYLIFSPVKQIYHGFTKNKVNAT